MEPEKTIETIDLTDPEQIDENPVIESFEEPEKTDIEIEAEETAPEDNGDQNAPEPAEDNADGTPEEPAVDYGAVISERIDKMESVLKDLYKAIDAITAKIENINNLEEARAAGPQGFFKPIEDDRIEKTNDGLPRIERIYK